MYIGNSKDEAYDQVLDEFTMDSLQYGIMEFELEVILILVFRVYFLFKKKKESKFFEMING